MNINLLDLLDQNGCRLRKVANTKGGEYAGACPFCGGNDRFRVWSETGRYWCRQCDKNGDAIQFVRETKGMGYREACNYLDVDVKNYQTGKWQKLKNSFVNRNSLKYKIIQIDKRFVDKNGFDNL